MTHSLHLLAINLTYRCNLRCKHCYMDAGGEHSPSELTSQQVEDLFTDIASRSDETMVVLTGGEPLLRRDLEQLASFGSEQGLSMVVGTNGLLLNRDRVISLKKSGVMGVGISLDSLDPDRHDSFCNTPGCWGKVMAALDHCRAEGLPFQIHFSVHQQNVDEIVEMIDFAASVGAHLINFFFLVCTGRGEEMSDISPAEYERVLQLLAEQQNQYSGLLIRARCAPYFRRITLSRQQADGEGDVSEHSLSGGGDCLAGRSYARITPEGDVTACPYIPDSLGSVTEQGFWSIWNEHPILKRLREPQLEGKCGICEYRQHCGGCRARPLALARSQGTDVEDVVPLLSQSDPWCTYEPGGVALISESESTNIQLEWSAEAEQRLKNIPGFVRQRVRQRAEEYVVQQGRDRVVIDDLMLLMRRRFASLPERVNHKGIPSQS